MVVLPQSSLDLMMVVIFDICTFFHLYADQSYQAAETIYLEPQQLKNHNAQSIDKPIIFLCLFFVWDFIDRRINQLTEEIINT